uniref:propanoyl-CoA C-acyltransferase n=2 Tax=Mucochytrium quahogii TaxID=96639 RepID=A0A7S2RX84_9STRA|mmetsp:Transcript_9977/g.18944  ORF Transcript_9977/g.18944 Transcript_9977/m.18944 type:complete len:299 (-) Transcript_9977:39-935(-)
MSGLNECCLALGVEKMKPGSLGGGGDGGATALDEHYRVMYEARGIAKAPPMAQFFGGAGREHQALYGTTDDQFAMIGEKNHRHSANNPYSQFRDVYTLDQIKSAPKVFEMLTKTQCSPTSDGAAAAIVCSEDFVIKHGLQGQAIEIIAQSARTDSPSAFDQKNKKRTMIELIGSAMARNCANDVYQQSGLTPEDVDVVELHDCFSANELITYEALQLCGEGEGGKLIESGNATFGGKYVVNPSGGLISKGHPLGATGIAQCAELNWQLRGECGPRQVKDAKVGLQHKYVFQSDCAFIF